jgi:predicted transcriptional regulator
MAKCSNIDRVQLTLRVPRGHAGFWAVIRELDVAGPWQMRDIDDRCNVDRASIKDYVHRLVRGGFVEQVGSVPPRRGKVNAFTYRLLQKPLEAPRLDRDGNVLAELMIEKLWRAMKMLKTFDATELAEVCGTAHQTAYKYLLALSKVGVVAPIDASKSLRKARYSLIQNLGAKAPSISKTYVVFDPNSKQVLGEPTLEVAP